MPRPHDEVSSAFVQRQTKTRAFLLFTAIAVLHGPVGLILPNGGPLCQSDYHHEPKADVKATKPIMGLSSIIPGQGRNCEQRAIFLMLSSFRALKPFSWSGSRQMSYPRAKRCGAFSTGCVASPWNYQTVLRRWFKSTARQKVSADQRWLPKPDSIRLTSDSWSAGSEARIWTRLRPSHTVWDSRFRS